MGRKDILWVSVLSFVVGVVGALLTLAVLSGTSREDTTPPIMSNIYISATPESVEASWTTNEPATTRVRCYVGGEAAGTVIVGPEAHQGLSTSHTALIIGIQPETRIYTITLISADASGNQTIHEFTTGAHTCRPPLSIRT